MSCPPRLVQLEVLFTTDLYITKPDLTHTSRQKEEEAQAEEEEDLQRQSSILTSPRPHFHPIPKRYLPDRRNLRLHW